MTDRHELQKRRENERLAEESDWRWLMGDMRGRRIIAKILAEAEVDKVIFNGNSRDAFALGRRALAVESIENRAKKHAHEDFLTMLREQRNG